MDHLEGLYPFNRTNMASITAACFYIRVWIQAILYPVCVGFVSIACELMWKSWSSVGKGGTSGIYCSQQLSTFQLTTTHLVICGNLRWQGCAVKAPRGVVCIYNYIGLLQKGPDNTQNDRSLSTDPNLILPIPRPIPTSHWYSLGTFHYRMLFKLGTEFVTYSHDYPLVI